MEGNPLSAMGLGLGNDVRADLERRPRREPSGTDEDGPRKPSDRALAALRLDWASAYVIDIDAAGVWWALRLDGKPAVSAPPGKDAPDELRRAILKDFAANPARPR